MLARARVRWVRLLAGPAPVAAVVLVTAAAAALLTSLRGGLTDLGVYQEAGRALLARPLDTAPRDPVTGLSFTYPPFAAVVMVPVSLVPAWLAAAVWTGASTAALAGAVVTVRRAQDRPAPGWLAAGVAGGAVALEPVWQNLAFGQVNVLVMTAVLVDLLGSERRWSGVLLGLVAGVKLTPLLFVVLLVAVGRRATARRALVTFGATVVTGFLLAPRWAASYWTDGLVDAGRVGPPSLAHNQSLYGALTRLLDERPSLLLWLAFAVPVGVAGVVAARAWWRRGEVLLATCLTALTALVVSPISWSHHWVWAVPVALVLWERSRWAAACWTAVFVARPVLWPPWGGRREYGWGPVEHLVGNAYLLAALAVCVWAVVGLTRRPAFAVGESARGRERFRMPRG